MSLDIDLIAVISDINTLEHLIYSHNYKDDAELIERLKRSKNALINILQKLEKGKMHA